MPSPLTLAIDADPVGRDGSGNERFLLGVIDGLRATLRTGERVILCGPDRAALEAAAQGHEAIEVMRTRGGWRGQVTWATAAGRRGANAALGHWNPPLLFSGTRGTVLHDAAFMAVPEAFPYRLRRRVEVSTRLSVLRSELIVTVSGFSASELVNYFPRARRRTIVVAPNAPRDMFRLSPTEASAAAAAARAALDLPDRFILAVGNLQPRKNIQSAVEAAAQLDVPLYVAGRAVWGGAAPADPRATWLGYVDDALLPGLYAAASVLCYPSFYEGYGLPVIEAMAAGCPVVCSHSSGLAEVAGDAAQLVDPGSVNDIARGLRQVLEDEPATREMVRRGYQRAASFSWTHTARRVLDAFHEAGAAKRPT